MPLRRNELAHELHPGGVTLSKPRPRTATRLYEIDAFFGLRLSSITRAGDLEDFARIFPP